MLVNSKQRERPSHFKTPLDMGGRSTVIESEPRATVGSGEIAIKRARSLWPGLVIIVKDEEE